MANPYERGYQRNNPRDFDDRGYSQPHDRGYDQNMNNMDFSQDRGYGTRNLTPTTPTFPTNGPNARMQPYPLTPRPPPIPPAPTAISRPSTATSQASFRSEKHEARTTSVQQIAPSSYFHSRRKGQGDIDKPWLKTKDRRQPWVTWIPCIGLLIGVALSGLLVFDGMRSTKMPAYCQILDENFSGGFDTKVWTKEAEVGGFGNGQFEQTTTTEENVFIQNGQLVIKPTLQDAKLIETNNIINLTKAGICTEATQLWSSCVTSTNTTNGTIIQPVKSGRINSKKGATIKYGRIEVEAQMPTGDWLWPAIWMLPVQNKYGAWPLSGEIDLAESRGNNYTYSLGGNNIVSSALHWGPDPGNDAWWRTNRHQNALHTTYSSDFHTYGLVWTPKYLYTYIDTLLLQVLYTQFAVPFWQRGKFPLADANGTSYIDPWSQTGEPSTPFDQDFYLILNVAVGGSNGWFKDGEDGKPWVDKSPTAKKDFWNARDSWYPTWQGTGKKDSKLSYGEMKVKSVKMWQQKGYNGC